MFFQVFFRNSAVVRFLLMRNMWKLSKLVMKHKLCFYLTGNIATSKMNEALPSFNAPTKPLDFESVRMSK